MSRPRYRWRTWLRAYAPTFLYRHGLLPGRGKSDCGQHEWYTHWRSPSGDVVGESCYHCEVGLRTRDVKTGVTSE